MGTTKAFMFHDIREFNPEFFPERYRLKSFLTFKQFAHQVNWIMSRHSIIGAGDLFSLDLKNDSSNYALLTFDDGLVDHFEVAKYLKQRGLVGIFLVPTRPIIHKKVMYSHKIQFLLSKVDESMLVKEILSHFEEKETLWEEHSRSKWRNN